MGGPESGADSRVQACALVLADGSRVRIRCLTNGDRDRADTLALLMTCSARDLRWRAGTVDPVAAARWLFPQRDGDIAIGALDEAGALVGVVNVNRRDSSTMEVSLIVTPSWRRHGLAIALLRAAVVARDRSTVLAVVSSGNTAAIGLARSVGATLTRVEPDDLEYLVPPHAVARRPPLRMRRRLDRGRAAG